MPMGSVDGSLPLMAEDLVYVVFGRWSLTLCLLVLGPGRCVCRASCAFAFACHVYLPCPCWCWCGCGLFGLVYLARLLVCVRV